MGIICRGFQFVNHFETIKFRRFSQSFLPKKKNKGYKIVTFSISCG
jgi:hypothetical protein